MAPPRRIRGRVHRARVVDRRPRPRKRLLRGLPAHGGDRVLVRAADRPRIARRPGADARRGNAAPYHRRAARGARGSRSAAGVSPSERPSACDLGRAWRVELGRRPEQGAHRGASTRGARGRDRTRARARSGSATSSSRPRWLSSPAGSSRRAASEAGSSARSSSSSRRSRRASSRSCSRRGGSSPPTCAPRTSASRRTASPTRSSGSSR